MPRFRKDGRMAPEGVMNMARMELPVPQRTKIDAFKHIMNNAEQKSGGRSWELKRDTEGLER